MPKTVPNQKYIIIKKEPSNAQNKYAIMNIKALEKALRELKECELKLWLYLNKNQNNHSFALSRQDIINNGILSDGSYKNAVKGLKEKGYIEENKNTYIFYEMPKNAEK